VKIIKHRVNSVKDLATIKNDWGLEIDLRATDQGRKIKVTHDVFTEGEDFDQWLEVFKSKKISGPLILNTKDDGLEEDLIVKMKEIDFQNYFFLDTTIPTLYHLIHAKKVKSQNLSVRLSAVEPLEFAKMFIGKVQWLWVDCFENKMVPLSWLNELKENFKICLVSPELQKLPENLIGEHKKYFANYADAVCTKFPDKWI
jgi:hypothetical protein